MSVINCSLLEKVDCVFPVPPDSIYLTYNKSFYRDGSLEPNEQIFFGVKIIPFTEIGVENIEDLIAN